MEALQLLAQAPRPTEFVMPQFGPLMMVAMLVNLGSLVCMIIVIVKMIQNGQTALGILSICCGLIALVVGWMNADAWGIKNLMLIWTGLIIIGIILGVANNVMMAPVVVR